MPYSSEPIPRIAFPPGLEATQAPNAALPAYKMISYAAAQETEHWTTYHGRGKKSSNRAKKRDRLPRSE